MAFQTGGRVLGALGGATAFPFVAGGAVGVATGNPIAALVGAVAAQPGGINLTLRQNDA